ncbi:MAG: dinF, partial [Acidimicrobiales bacterium]|nr:dinF [Acidimicrobiales bacterium]
MMRHVARALDREIFRLAVPALGALAAEPLYVLTDTAIVGHLGTPELGGLAVASTILISGYAMFIFLAYGTTGSVARLLGAGHADRAAAQGVQALWLALGIGATLAALGLVFGDALVRLMGAEGETAVHARSYLRI